MSNMTICKNEITVDTSNGEVYISQRKAAEILGVSKSGISNYIERSSRPEEIDISQGLSSEIFNSCAQYFALDSRSPTTEAKALLKQISQAGTKAYLYHQAGYVMEAKKPEPELSFFDSLAASFARMAEVERSQSEQGVMMLSIQERVHAVESRQSAIQDQSSYYSVLAFGIKNNLKLTTGQASGLSRKCGNISSSLGYTVGKIADPRFGTVKTYHESVLMEVFNSKGYIEN